MDQGIHLVEESKKRTVQALSGQDYSFREDDLLVKGINSVNAAHTYNERQIGLEAKIDTTSDHIIRNRERIIGPQPPSGARKYSDVFALSLANGGRELVEFLNRNHDRIHGGIEPILVMLLVNMYGPEIVKQLSHIKRTDQTLNE